MSRSALRGVRVVVADFRKPPEIWVEGIVPSLITVVAMTVLIVPLPLLLAWNRANWDEMGEEIAPILEARYGPRE